MLLSIDVESLVGGSIRPSLATLTVLLIFLPIAHIGGPVKVGVLAVTLSFIVEPVSLVDIAVSVDESALAICFVITPVALINAAIRPQNCAASLFSFSALNVLASVASARLDGGNWSLL